MMKSSILKILTSVIRSERLIDNVLNFKTLFSSEILETSLIISYLCSHIMIFIYIIDRDFGFDQICTWCTGQFTQRTDQLLT